MHVLVSAGRFDPATPDRPGLGAVEASAAVVAGWQDARPDDRVEAVPLNDGGPGLIDVLHAARGGELIAVTVPDAGGQPVPSAVLVLTEDSGARTAYVDGSVALGGSAAVASATTAGLGHLLRAALETGAQRIVIGTGPRHVTAHDAGWGLLRVLLGEDAGPAPVLDGRQRPMIDLAALRETLHDRDLVLLGQHDQALLGLNGASAALVGAGRATAEEAQAVERRMGDLVAALTDAAGPGRANLLATPHTHDHGPRAAATALTGTRPAVAPGSGAGGGAAFALGLLGARRVDGATWIADAVRLADRVESADLVVTGAGVLDGTGLEEGVVPAVSAVALPLGIPVIALAAQVRSGRRDWGAAGIAGAFEVVESPQRDADWQQGPAAALRARVPRVARTWSR